MRFAGGAWPRGRFVLAGELLTVAGIVLRSQPAGMVILPGLLLIFSAPLIPAVPGADRKRNFELTRELAAGPTPPSGAILKRLLINTQPKTPPSYAPSSRVKLWLTFPTGLPARDGTAPASEGRRPARPGGNGITSPVR